MRSLSSGLRIFATVLAIIIVVGTLGFAAIEDLPFIDAFYLCVMTISTVGYGDIVPVTPAGKMLSLFIVIVGVGTFLGLIAHMTEIFMSSRERQVRREKLHIIVGVFYSECGTELLRKFVSYDTRVESIRDELAIKDSWTSRDYDVAKLAIKDYAYAVDTSKVNFEELREFLESKSALFLRLMENPYILEHETFTNLLRAVLHLKEELLHREGFAGLPEPDLKHLAGDIKRAYTLLVVEWLDYMSYLQGQFPYLFSLARRTNPLDPKATAVVS